MDLDKNVAAPNGLVSLAEWHCDETLWKAFRRSEMLPYKGSLRAANHLALGAVGVIAVVLALVVALVLSGQMKWQTSLGFVAGDIVLGGVFVFAGILVGFRRRKREGALNKPTGDVVMALEGFAYNGFQVDWGFGKEGMRFQHAERSTVKGDLRYSFEILVFDTDAMVFIGKTWTHETWKWNVPVPADKIAIADMVCDRLNTRRSTIEFSA